MNTEPRPILAYLATAAALALVGCGDTIGSVGNVNTSTSSSEILPLVPLPTHTIDGTYTGLPEGFEALVDNVCNAFVVASEDDSEQLDATDGAVSWNSEWACTTATDLFSTNEDTESVVGELRLEANETLTEGYLLLQSESPLDGDACGLRLLAHTPGATTIAAMPAGGGPFPVIVGGEVLPEGGASTNNSATPEGEDSEAWVLEAVLPGDISQLRLALIAQTSDAACAFPLAAPDDTEASAYAGEGAWIPSENAAQMETLTAGLVAATPNPVRGGSWVRVWATDSLSEDHTWVVGGAQTTLASRGSTLLPWIQMPESGDSTFSTSLMRTTETQTDRIELTVSSGSEASATLLEPTAAVVDGQWTEDVEGQVEYADGQPAGSAGVTALLAVAPNGDALDGHALFMLEQDDACPEGETALLSVITPGLDSPVLTELTGDPITPGPAGEFDGLLAKSTTVTPRSTTERPAVELSITDLATNGPATLQVECSGGQILFTTQLETTNGITGIARF